MSRGLLVYTLGQIFFFFFVLCLVFNLLIFHYVAQPQWTTSGCFYLQIQLWLRMRFQTAVCWDFFKQNSFFAGNLLTARKWKLFEERSVWMIFPL